MASKAQCKSIHELKFRGRKLLPLSKNIYKKFFQGADEHWYYTREEFGDGSCFFHSLATLLNLHSDKSSQSQASVLHNIKRRMKEACTHSDVTACFDFVRNDYGAATEAQRKQLGHHLRRYVMDAVNSKWDGFWKSKTQSQPELLNRVYDKGQVKKMLMDTSVWADVYVILFAMEVLDVNILFFDENKGSIYCGVHGNNMKTQPTVFVLWVNNSHFQPILRLSCSADGQQQVKGLFWHGSDDVVKHVFERWEKQEQCPAVGLDMVLL